MKNTNLPLLLFVLGLFSCFAGSFSANAETPAVTVNGRTFVSLKTLKQFGLEVLGDTTGLKIIIREKQGTKKVEIQPGQTILVNLFYRREAQKESGVALLYPLRLIAKGLGYPLDYKARQIFIVKVKKVAGCDFLVKDVQRWVIKPEPYLDLCFDRLTGKGRYQNEIFAVWLTRVPPQGWFSIYRREKEVFVDPRISKNKQKEGFRLFFWGEKAIAGMPAKTWKNSDYCRVKLEDAQKLWEVPLGTLVHIRGS